jgi:glutaredoxin 3
MVPGIVQQPPDAESQRAILNEVMKPVVLYTTEMCPYCRSAKALLEKRGVEYEEINLARDPDGRDTLQGITGMVTFPQIVIGDTPIGGFDQLLAADRSGRLPELLAA